MLELKNIVKEYQTGNTSLTALRGISIAFRKSEFVAILGQSGCGKTTLLNIIGGLDKYTDGDLIIYGLSTKEYKDANWDAYRNHSIGFVFQSYNLIPHQTVLSNVELALTLSGVSKTERKQRAIEALTKVGLADQLHKKPNQMSGGQMQRVAIARALVNNPDILLADEPTGALDSETSIQIMDILKEIAKEKLVIMVTHNPEIADTYANRIVRLLDGKIIGDTNPYTPINEDVKKDKPKKIAKNKSMSFLTALSLSFNNLMTKKGRTILTAFAGSIGIIGIALILSVSQGVTNYIATVEESTMASYPITIEKSTNDTTSMMQSFLEHESTPAPDGMVGSNNFMIQLIESLQNSQKENNISKFKEYLESDECQIDENASDIVYNYSTTLNTYYKVEQEDGTYKYQKTYSNPTELITGIMSGGMVTPSYGSNSLNTVFQQMIGNDELIKSQYDIVYGDYPKADNEVLILVDENNRISDYTLYALGIRDVKEIIEYIKANDLHLKDPANNPKPEDLKETTYTYEELCSKSYKVLLNSDLYKVDNNLIKYRSNEEINEILDKSTKEIKVVGIVKPSEESQSAISVGGILYKKDLMLSYIKDVNNSEVVTLQTSNKTTNLIWNRDFDNLYTEADYLTILSKLTTNQTLMMAFYNGKYDQKDPASVAKFANTYMLGTYESTLKDLGCIDLDNPNSINIYPKDFDSKELITNEISVYNNKQAEDDRIIYSDLVGVLLSSVTIIVNAISYVLVAFVSISLVVSSIMIGIITYISVLERTKEIGILRAIGASKKDISRVFNAETVTVGFIAGAIGIIVTLLLIIPINIILHNLTGISYLSAYLPPVAAVVLVAISILLTFIAGLIPSGFAARKDPVVALRTE